MLRCFLLVSMVVLAWGCARPTAAPQPNIVLLVADDLGYSDLALYADTGLVTPHLERMASNGMRFTDFYVAAAFCSPSRAALLTGKYPQRVGIYRGLNPQTDIGLPPGEVTLAEMLRSEGYATACFGKWHLGHLERHLPPNHGFDEYFGIPYSNDMTPDSTINPNPYARRHPPLPLVDGVMTVETEPDQRYLTRRYTERAVDFIERSGDQPFFLYLPYAAPHVPLFVSEAFDGASGRGLYSDVLLEIDWSVGQILDALERQGIEKSTLVFFTSDNGPWLVKGAESGSAVPLRGGKRTTFEGGQRVPLLAYWPGVIPAGSVMSEMATAMDLMPTIAAFAGINHNSWSWDGHDIGAYWPGVIPAGSVMSEMATAMDLMPTIAAFAGINHNSWSWDGHDIGALLRGTPGATSPYNAFFFVQGLQVESVRAGSWKLHVPHRYRRISRASLSTPTRPKSYVQDSIGLALFDLAADNGERHNVAQVHLDVVTRLSALVDTAQARLTLKRTVMSQ